MPRSASAAAGTLLAKGARLPQVPSNEQLLDNVILNDLEICIIDRYETAGVAAPIPPAKGLTKAPSSILKKDTAAAHRQAASLNVNSSTRRILSHYSAPLYKDPKVPNTHANANSIYAIESAESSLNGINIDIGSI